MATKGVGHVAVGEHPASAPAGSRFPCFDGLRALAALGVFVFHASVIFQLQTKTFVPSAALRWISPLGTTGVAIFFVISGFLLYRPFAVATFEGRPSPRTPQFWKRRFFRIFPAYWVALAFAIWVFADTQVHTLSQGLTTFGLLQNYRAEYTLLGLGVAWTLVIELSFYLVLPLIAWCARAVCDRVPTLTAKMTAQLAVIAALATISLLLRYWYFFDATLHGGTRGAWLALPQLRFWLPSYLDWFAYGMAMAVASAWLSAGGRIPGIVAFLGRVPSLSWLLALGCFWVVVQIAVFDSSPSAFPTQEYLRFILYGLVGAFFVLPAVFGDQRRSGTRAFLQAPVLVMLGVVSYGIYLWHFPIWLQLHAWFPSGMPMPLQFVVVLAATVAAAVASWELVERPIVRWSTGRAPASLFTGHTVAASLRGAPAPEPEAAPEYRVERDAERPVARVVVAGAIVLLALAGIVVGSLRLNSQYATGTVDAYRWTPERSIVRDTFDRVDAASLGTAPTGQPWLPLSGTWSIAGRAASVTGQGFAVVRAPASRARATGAGLAFRCRDAANCWWVRPVPEVPTWNVNKVVNGRTTYEGNIGYAPADPGAVVAVHLVDSRIVITVNGVVRRTIDDPDLRDAVGVGLAATPGAARTTWTHFDADR